MWYIFMYFYSTANQHYTQWDFKSKLIPELIANTQLTATTQFTNFLPFGPLVKFVNINVYKCIFF